MRTDIQKLRRENIALRELVSHCWVHSGYPNCGYDQMDSEMRAVYDRLKGCEPDDVETVELFPDRLKLLREKLDAACKEMGFELLENEPLKFVRDTTPTGGDDDGQRA